MKNSKAIPGKSLSTIITTLKLQNDPEILSKTFQSLIDSISTLKNNQCPTEELAVLLQEDHLLVKALLVDKYKDRPKGGLFDTLSEIIQAGESKSQEWLNKFGYIHLSALPDHASSGLIKKLQVQISWDDSTLTSESFGYVLKWNDKNKIASFLNSAASDQNKLGSEGTASQPFRGVLNKLSTIKITDELFDVIKNYIPNIITAFTVRINNKKCIHEDFADGFYKVFLKEVVESKQNDCFMAFISYVGKNNINVDDCFAGFLKSSIDSSDNLFAQKIYWLITEAVELKSPQLFQCFMDNIVTKDLITLSTYMKLKNAGLALNNFGSNVVTKDNEVHQNNQLQKITDDNNIQITGDNKEDNLEVNV